MWLEPPIHTECKHSVLSFRLSFSSHWFIRYVFYVRFRNAGFCEKCGSKYYCHNFSLPGVLRVFSEEAVTLGEIAWKESFSKLYAFCHVFLFASCTDSVMETVRCYIYFMLLLAVPYHLWFWFIVLFLCNSIRNSCCKEFQVADWLWARAFNVQNVSLCDDLNSHLSFTDYDLWFESHRLVNNVVLSI